MNDSIRIDNEHPQISNKIEDFKIQSIYYLIQVDGDPKFRLKAKSAKKNGVKAEFTAAGWVYQNKGDAEEVAKRWTRGKRTLCVVRWFDSRLNLIWNGSEDEARLAKKLIRLEIDSDQVNKKREEIKLQCHQSPLHWSWLYEKDICKLEAADCSKEELKAYHHFKPLWDKALEEEAEIDLRAADIACEEEDVNEEKKQLIPFDNVTKSLIRNEIGDAELFLMLLKDKYIFDSSEGKSGEFYVWTGTHWQLDRNKQRYNDIELVSDCYEQASIEIGKDKEKKEIRDLLSKRAFALRSAKRCKSVFEFISCKIPFNGDWDYCPGLLPCKNGIIDLRTGALIPPCPNYFIRTICPVEYNENAKCPRFEKFLDEITLDRAEIRNCIEDAFGSALMGIPKEELIFYFYGEEGRNGKGSLLQTIENVLGRYAKTFPSEMLILQRNPPSSDSPSPALANLQGVRFAIFSEINKGRKIDSSKVKNLSGRDTIPCRRLFSNVDLEIKPSHTMFIQTNIKPEAPADDNALWTRNILIPFEAYFCDSPDKENKKHRKKDPEMKAKLMEEKEGILAWLVRCCINYQKNGLRIPDLVKKATADYRRENDGIQIFIDDRCTIDSSLSTPCSKMQKEIKEYCNELGINKPTEREISKRLESMFQKKKSNVGWRYLGIGITPQQRECEE